MTRVFSFASVALLLAVVAVHAQQNEPEVIDWNKLPQWGEKSLAPEIGDSVYRAFLWTPFWGQALARLTIHADSTAELTTKVRAFDEPHSITSSSRVLEKTEVDAFLSAVTDAHFWSLPPDAAKDKKPRHVIEDADSCAMEASAEGTYHAARRLSGRKNSTFTHACEYFVRPAIVNAAKAKRRH